MLAQAVLDLATCFLIALIAARLAPGNPATRCSRGLMAGWLVSIYRKLFGRGDNRNSGYFLTTLALLILLETDFGQPNACRARLAPFGTITLSPWFLAGSLSDSERWYVPRRRYCLLRRRLVFIAKWWRPAIG